jgi:hypothetical protein
MNNEQKLKNMIEALEEHQNDSSVGVLERVGTNSSNDEVRRLTAKALVKRNSIDSLHVVITNPGKGINDLSTNVAMSTINEILALKDKTNALKVLTDIEESDFDENVKETARSVKTLMNF